MSPLILQSVHLLHPPLVPREPQERTGEEVVNNPVVNNSVVNNPVVNNPEIDIVEVYDLTEDEPQAEDPPCHIGVQLHLQHPNLNPTMQLIRLPKK